MTAIGVDRRGAGRRRSRRPARSSAPSPRGGPGWPPRAPRRRSGRARRRCSRPRRPAACGRARCRHRSRRTRSRSRGPGARPWPHHRRPTMEACVPWGSRSCTTCRSSATSSIPQLVERRLAGRGRRRRRSCAGRWWTGPSGRCHRLRARDRLRRLLDAGGRPGGRRPTGSWSTAPRRGRARRVAADRGPALALDADHPRPAARDRRGRGGRSDDRRGHRAARRRRPRLPRPPRHAGHGGLARRPRRRDGWSRSARWLRQPDGTGHLRAVTVLAARPRPGPRARAQHGADPARRWRGPGVASLGVYLDNEPALRIYRGLGYEVAHTFSSGPVSGSSITTAVAPSR